VQATGINPNRCEMVIVFFWMKELRERSCQPTGKGLMFNGLIFIHIKKKKTGHPKGVSGSSGSGCKKRKCFQKGKCRLTIGKRLLWGESDVAKRNRTGSGANRRLKDKELCFLEGKKRTQNLCCRREIPTWGSPWKPSPEQKQGGTDLLKKKVLLQTADL